MGDLNLFDKILFGLHSIISLVVMTLGIYIIIGLFAIIYGIGPGLFIVLVLWILLDVYEALKFKKLGYIAELGGYIKNKKKDE